MIGCKIAHAYVTIFGLIGIWWLLFFLYRDTAIDLFRQKMFALRDDLFDEAVRGTISFDHPAYGLLRGTMNGYIRFAHRLDMANVIMLSLFIKSDDIAGVDRFLFPARWERVTSDLTPETKAVLRTYKNRMDSLAFRRLILGSPLVMLLILMMILSVLPLIVVLLVRQSIVRALKKAFSGPLRDMESAAMACGNG